MRVGWRVSRARWQLGVVRLWGRGLEGGSAGPEGPWVCSHRALKTGRVAACSRPHFPRVWNEGMTPPPPGALQAVSERENALTAARSVTGVRKGFTQSWWWAPSNAALP